jgi:hypothetical protein
MENFRGARRHYAAGSLTAVPQVGSNGDRVTGERTSCGDNLFALFFVQEVLRSGPEFFAHEYGYFMLNGTRRVILLTDAPYLQAIA